MAGLIGWGLAVGPAHAPAEAGGGDLQLYAAVTSRVTAGEDYYHVLAEELPARGYATEPVFNWRLPTLTWLNSIPPSRFWGQAVFVLLVPAVIILWLLVVRLTAPRMFELGIPVLLVANAPLVAVRGSALLYEVWAGLLIAASLGCWALDRRGSSAALGVAALLIRELALPFALIMAAMAWRESRRREAGWWLIGISVFSGYWLWHAARVMSVVPADGLRNSWTALGGWEFVLAAAHSSVFLMLLPQHWVAAVLVPLAWAGLWHWENAVGRRLALTVTGYFAMFMVIGRPDNWYWGFLVAPLIPLGCFGFFSESKPKA